MSTNTEQKEQKGPNLQALGFKDAMEVIDLLAFITFDGENVIKDQQAYLDPKLKARQVMEYYYETFNVKPELLPYLAAVLKKRLLNRSKN